MGILLKHNLSRYGWVILGFLAVILLGFFLAIQGCAPSAQDTGGSSQEGSGTTGPKGGELAPAPEVGRLAPDFTLVDLEGNEVTLSDFRGKTVFLNFWATWCPPCRAEMPEIEAVYQEYKNKDVVVIGVDIRETKAEVLQFVQQGGYTWTFVLDTSGEVTVNYQITAIPTSFFIDGDGIIQSVIDYAMSKRAMEVELTKAMR
jgi:thiol-disulfide isomerase/thioredoxin